MKKIKKEFEEILFTKTEGRMLEQLTVRSVVYIRMHDVMVTSFNYIFVIIQVREYFFGTSVPVITKASVIRIERSSDEVKSLEVCYTVKHLLLIHY